tara:strand:+ start:9956 stop:10117 length:162 start_codon:yes stop_codon:yes gene_type:complete
MQQQSTYSVYQLSARQSKVKLKDSIYNDMHKKFIFFGINVGILCLLATLGYWV